MRSIYLLVLSLLSHRGREIGSELTQPQDQAPDHFLKEYSDQLLHIAAWMAREEDAPERIAGDSIGLPRQTFEDHSSPNSRAIADICRQMVSSLLILRNEVLIALDQRNSTQCRRCGDEWVTRLLRPGDARSSRSIWQSSGTVVQENDRKTRSRVGKCFRMNKAVTVGA